jgi:hypothetical protein
MFPLSEAIELSDFVTVHKIFKAADFEPPLIRWDPKPEDIQIDELRFLLNYWLGLKKDEKVPHLSKVDALDLAPCLGYLMLVDINEDEFTHRVYGTKIAQATGFDLTGKTVSSIPTHKFIPTFFSACYQAARSRQTPILTEHRTPPTVSVYSWTRLTLPLIDDSGKVARFLAGSVPGEFKLDRPVASLF